MTTSHVRTITLLVAAVSVLAAVVLARIGVPLFREQARGVAMARAAQQQMADLRQENERAACAAHLATLGQLLDAYVHRSDNTKRLLPDSLQQAVTEGERDTLSCPAGRQPYVYLGKGRRNLGPDVVTVYEPLTAHGDGAHFLFADRRVEWMDKPKAEGVIRRLQAGQNPP
jgi:hypothetical protein